MKPMQTATPVLHDVRTMCWTPCDPGRRQPAECKGHSSGTWTRGSGAYLCAGLARAPCPFRTIRLTRRLLGWFGLPWLILLTAWLTGLTACRSRLTGYLGLAFGPLGVKNTILLGGKFSVGQGEWLSMCTSSSDGGSAMIHGCGVEGGGGASSSSSAGSGAASFRISSSSGASSSSSATAGAAPGGGGCSCWPACLSTASSAD
jgi:hypothetical protein